MTLTIPEFRLESGRVLKEVPVAYHTWGELNEGRDNVIAICHALTGNSEADTWWGPMIGPGRAFDTDRYLVICANVLGSCYGTAGPTTMNPETGRSYGPDFPATTIRDNVNLHRILFDKLGINQIVTAVGGSMGGMHALEWAYQGDYVQTIIPIAVGGRHSAWCIGWSEAQRQAIYADPLWNGGNYDPASPPVAGLAAARMSAMISYRSRRSFEQRFGRELQADGGGSEELFAVEGYLRYQGQKLVDRFDANTYVHLSRQMDTHDVARGRGKYPDVLAQIRQPALVVGIDSDILYPLVEQEELVDYIPEAKFALLESPHGHDAFLIEHNSLNEIIQKWLQKVDLPSVSTWS